MKVKFTWETMVAQEEMELDIADMSKDSLISIIKILFSQIPGTDINRNIRFNFQDYFIHQVKTNKRMSSVGVTKEDLEKVICLISNENNSVVPVKVPVDRKYLN